MGLAGRKEKQKIGDDPRNTKWARSWVSMFPLYGISPDSIRYLVQRLSREYGLTNRYHLDVVTWPNEQLTLADEDNPGFKLLSSMGWTPAAKTLGLNGDSSSSITTWKKHPSAALPVIKSTTSGLGANPNMASSYCGIGGAPCFVRSTMSENDLKPSDKTVVDIQPVETEQDRKEKLAIVAGGNGGGFSDLLSRLNQARSTGQDLNPPLVEGFVMVQIPEKASECASNERRGHDAKHERKTKKKKKRDPAPVVEEQCTVPSLKRKKTKESIEEPSRNAQDAAGDSEQSKKPRKRVRIAEDPETSKIDEKIPKPSKLSKKPRTKVSKNWSERKTSVIVEAQPTAKENGNVEEVTPSTHLTISRPMNPRMALVPTYQSRLLTLFGAVGWWLFICASARSKYIRSKKLATSSNAAAMAEILGIPSA